MWSFIRGLISDPQTTPNDVNLLLLGETGVGKSTLINSISNYFHYTTFAKAQKGKIELLIPMCLNVAEKSKVFGKPDDNEVHEPGKSVTQNVKVYLFPIKLGRKTINLRLIDTPGVGDPRGIEQDNINLDNVLAYLATLKELHGICFVLKANQTRFTKFAEYCLKQILTRLDKSASQNIIFITTYSKTSGYTAGETKSHCLAPLVKNIRSRPPNVSIPLSDKNIFSVDNEAFKALLALQDGIYYHQHAVKGFEQSWIKSTKEIQRLLKYIIGDSKHSALKPHDVENTVSINEARFLIEQLTTPIAEVSELIQDNIRVLDKHQKSLQQEDQTLDQLKDQLYIPCVDLEVKELDEPVSVCTESSCTEIVKVNNVTLRLHKQQCHKPCYLKGVPKEMVGHPGLENCAVMVQGNCMRCGCSWKKHLHIYKETQKVEVKKEDQNVKNTIKSKEDARVHIEKTLNNVNQRRTELEAEGTTISKTIAKFAYFLQEHALTPFNDLYSAYIKQRIADEKRLGKFADQQVITKLESMLKDHEQLQKTLQENPKGLQTGGSDLTLEGIKNSVTELYNLKHMGKKIQELINKSSNSRRKEHQENFSCLVSQEIDLNKNIAEEQYENREYGESYNDESGMQQGRNKSSVNEYYPEATGDNHYDDYTSYESFYGTTYAPRSSEEKSQTSRFDHASNARQHPRRTPERSSPYPRKRDDYSREDFYEDTSRGHGPRNQHFRDSDNRRRESMAQHNTRAHQRYKGRYETSPSRRENLYSSGRSKSPEDYYDLEAEKSSHRGHRSKEYSSRHNHRGRSRSHDSDSKRSPRRDHTAKHRHESSESSYSDGSHSAESYGSRHSVKHSKNQRESKSKHHDSDNDHSKKTNRSKNTSSRRSKDREVYDNTRAETKSKHKTHDKVKESSRRHRHRSDSYDSDEPMYTTKNKHSKHEDKSYSENSDSDGNYSSRNTDKQTKNQKDTKPKKNYDSDGNRSTKPSKTKHSASKSSHESRDKSSTKSKSGHKKHTEFKRKSSPVDIKSSKEKASKIQNKPKSEDEESSGSSSQDSSHSSDHRPDKSSKTRRQETRDPDDKSSERSSRSGDKKHTESKKGRKSSPVGQRYESDDQQHNKSSRKKHRSKESESKRSKQSKSENENSDSEAKSSKSGGKVPKSGQETRDRGDKSKNSSGSGHKKSAESKTAKPFMKEESKRRQKHKSEDENSDSDGKEPIYVSSQKREQSSQPSSDRSNKSPKTGKSRDESDSRSAKPSVKEVESKRRKNYKPEDDNSDSDCNTGCSVRCW
ncbi:hypothetical protein Zmor_015094 [Zophobas morio]|uniref:G domain-containing protein n=1 Tax=Zophobas morio TaxID=2755281 RepID=A0AA38MHK2_9CUCU|nr:hypothetical protein Zmor_015094 [Zophobas morio]